MGTLEEKISKEEMLEDKLEIERMFEASKMYALDKMERRLPDKMLYHNIHHTFYDVLPAVETIGRIEGVTKEELTLIKTAAVFHDYGFLFKYDNNEEIAVNEINRILPRFGYDYNKIEQIGEIIMATKMKEVEGVLRQAPDENKLLQKIMCDSDLNYLGTTDFFKRSESLRVERRLNKGERKSKFEWDEDNFLFLKNHQYFTKACEFWRGNGKERNIQILKKKLSGLI